MLVFWQIGGLKIFSPSLCLIFISTSYGQKFLILVKSSLSVSSFVDCVFHIKAKKPLPGLRFQRFSTFFY